MTDRQAFAPPARKRIGIVGSGIAGLSAAWLLSQHHDVMLFEADSRLGGHSNTVEVDGVGVDTGFIVYNETTYPNLTALFAHLGIETEASLMSFAVSLDGGALEYAGSGLRGLFAQKRNLVSPRFAAMLADLLRFYRNAPRDLPTLGTQSLADYLDAERYGAAFRDDHLLPMAAAIWSTGTADVAAYPAAAFIRFCQNHGLLQLAGRPVWRTVKGGSRRYVEALRRAFKGRILVSTPIRRVLRTAEGVALFAREGGAWHFDDVVIAAHADQALAMIDGPTAGERALLGAFRYTSNEAVLHCDERLMPRRRAVWSAWNYLSDRRADRHVCVSYWMNRLQALPEKRNFFVTLNPIEAPAQKTLAYRTRYDHPLFNAGAMAAQRRLWSLQGDGGLWYCGAYFGAGFHEDGLQAGLAVAEALGGAPRPWRLADPSGRIVLTPPESGPYAAHPLAHRESAA